MKKGDFVKYSYMNNDGKVIEGYGTFQGYSYGFSLPDIIEDSVTKKNIYLKRSEVEIVKKIAP